MISSVTSTRTARCALLLASLALAALPALRATTSTATLTVDAAAAETARNMKALAREMNTYISTTQADNKTEGLMRALSNNNHNQVRFFTNLSKIYPTSSSTGDFDYSNGSGQLTNYQRLDLAGAWGGQIYMCLDGTPTWSSTDGTSSGAPTDYALYETQLRDALVNYKTRYANLVNIEARNENGFTASVYYGIFQRFQNAVNYVNANVSNGAPLKLVVMPKSSFDLNWIKGVIDQYAADTNAAKMLDGIAWHDYRFGELKEKIQGVETQASQIRSYLTTKGLPSTIPLFCSEYGPFPTSDGTSSLSRDQVTQASAAAMFGYYFYKGDDNVFPLYWVTIHSNNAAKNVIGASTAGVFYPAYNYLRSLASLKDTRVTASSSALSTDGVGLAGTGTKDATGVAALLWNYQWTNVNTKQRGTATWTDYTYQATVRPIDVTEANAKVGLSAYAGTSTDVKEIQIRYQFVYNPAAGTLAIERLKDRTLTSLASKSYSLTSGTNYTFKAVLAPGTSSTVLTLYVNGTQELTVTDTSSSRYSAGVVGVVADFCQAAFDDVSVTKNSDSSSLLSDDFESGTFSSWQSSYTAGTWSVATIGGSKMLQQTKLPQRYTTTVQFNNLDTKFGNYPALAETYLIDSLSSNYQADSTNYDLEMADSRILSAATSQSLAIPFTLEENALSFIRLTPLVPPTSALSSGYWKFDESSGTSAADATGKGRTGTLGSGASFTASGQLANAVALDGTANAYVSVADHADLDLTSKLYFAARVYIGSGAGTTEYRLAQKLQGSGSAAPYAVRLGSNGKIGLYWNGSWKESWFTGWNNGQWYRIEVQHDGANISFKRDGLPLGAVADTTTTNATDGALYLGQSGGATAYALNGRLDDLVLSARNPYADAGQWKFDENTGATTADASGNGNTGTLNAGVSWTTGVSNSALSFNGTSGQVDIADANSLDLVQKIYLDVRVNISSGAGTTARRVLTKQKGAASLAPYALEIRSNGKIGLYWNGAWRESNALTWSNNTWYRVEARYDGANVTFYRDGAAAGSLALTGATNASDGGLWLGRGSTGSENWFAGKIDELRVAENP